MTATRGRGMRCLARSTTLFVGTSGLLIQSGIDTKASAQATESLPPITVEAAKKTSKPGSVAKARSKTSAAKPNPQPAAVAETAAEPAPAVAPQDVPYQTPASVSSASIGEINTFGQTNADDVLRAMPGTFTRDSTNNPGLAVNIRGFEGSGRVNMMIDGVRQNFRFTGHEAQGFAYVDPSLLAGVDVARGAVSTTGGAGALAGTANFRTLDVDDIVKPGKSTGVLSSVTYGTNNADWAEMLAVAGRTDSVGIAAAISKRQPDDYKNGDGVTVPFTEQDLESGLFKAEFRPSSEHQLKFGGVKYENDFLANSYFQNIDSRILTANYTYNPAAAELINLKVNASRSDLTIEYDTNATGGGTAAGRVIDDNGYGFDITNTSLFHVGAVRVKAQYGYEYFFDDVSVLNSTAVPGRGVNPSGKSSISSVFSETTFSYGIFDLIGGLRYDMFQLEGSGSVTASNPIGMPAGAYEVDRDDGRVNPKVTLAARPLPWLQPYVTYAEAFRAPTINETLTGGSHPPTGGPPQSFFPNPFLEPEVQKGWEFGTNVSFDGLLRRNDRFRLKADYFTQDVDNYITACFAPSVYFCNNPGTSQVQGVEVQGNYDAGFVFAALAYSYTDSDLPSQANGFGAQSFLPDQVVTVTAGLRFLQERLTIGARATFISEAYIGEINGDPPYTDGYELVDLFSSYVFDGGLELGLTVSNLTDEAYSPALSTIGTNFNGDTGRGRTALFTARAHF